ncbi:unnamed protein product, partial [Brenthis ino]
MLRIALVCLFVLQVKSDETSLPSKCRQSFIIPKNPLSCCIIPSLYKDKDYSDCGIERKLDEDGILETGPFDIPCEKQTCLLKKNNLMKDDTIVDKEAFTAYIDTWAGGNEELKNGIEFAKNKCIKEILPGPKGLCEANKLIYCIVTAIYDKCPNWKETDLCQKLKERIDDC